MCNISYIITLSCVIVGMQAIGIPVHQQKRCMIIQGQMDPVKLQLKFPQIPNKEEGEKFNVYLLDLTDNQILFDVFLQEKTIYRKNLELVYNKMYEVCISLDTSRYLDSRTQKIYVQYTADQDFNSLIGKIEIPKQLVGEVNLQYIYNMSQSITHLNKKIAQNQVRERQIQQTIANSNLHKNQRINMFTIIECVVIVVSGIYQVMSLRRFLIEKNLY